MSAYELEGYLEYGKYAKMDDWEQARLIAYLVAQVNSKDKLKPTDIIEFDWDKDKKSDEQKVTDEEKKAVEAWARQISKLLPQ